MYKGTFVGSLVIDSSIVQSSIGGNPRIRKFMMGHLNCKMLITTVTSTPAMLPSSQVGPATCDERLFDRNNLA